jgi:glycosyltransferase involved in cell wall biosynthesis
MFVALMESNSKEALYHRMPQKPNPISFNEILLMIPTLNEEKAIGELVNEAHTVGFRNILVVDGFSTDQTREIARKAKANVILQEFGTGKGCGVRTGMREFLRGDTGLLCILDGDGTNIPSFLMDMIPLAISGEVDVVIGSRTRGPREQDSMDLLSLTSNLTVSFLLGIKFGRIFTDVQTGYWLFTKRAVEAIYPNIQSKGFEIELELFVKILKARLKVAEVPVGFRCRKGFTKFSFMLRLRNLYYAFKFLSS